MWRLLQYKGAYDALMDECDEAMRDAIKPRLASLLTKGNEARYPVTESLNEGLFEVRARCGRVRIRLLFGFLPGRRVVFVWGGTKDQKRLRAETIARARILLAEARAAQEKLGDITVH
jgi:hypothetical protein